jgi:glycosyltransferase involved in cell wall biosynthesis
VAVGNVKPHKNIGRLLKAMSLLPPSCAGLHLVIIGQRDGFLNGDESIADLANALGARVHFTGKLSQTDLRRFVTHAQALVFPSLYEGFGLPPLEAMALGTVTIASRIPAVEEVCDDAVQYIDPSDPGSIALGIASVVGDRDRRRALVERGRKRVRLFSWQSAADETWSSIAALL